VELDFDRCYGAVCSKDPRFDGWFITAVKTTGIYCRPSCPAVTPKPGNVRFFRTPAAAHEAGFRACKRCRPDAAPGSPEWNLRADVVGRAMRLIADGVADREGVSGLARRLGYSERHLHRQLVAELGAGPQAIARAQRAQTARLLVESTSLPFSDVAFAAGFSSIRTFNETIAEVFARTPTELRRLRRGDAGGPGALSLRLPYRSPFDDGVLEFVGRRSVRRVEEHDPAERSYARSLALPHGEGVVALRPGADYVACTLRLADLRDLAAAVQRCRTLLDLDADPGAASAHLARDPALRPLVERSPGRRIPGSADSFETAVRAVLGQQVSVTGANTLAGRLVEAHGKPLTAPSGGVTHLFPGADALAGADLAEGGMPGARRRALRSLAEAVSDGALVLDGAAARDDVTAALRGLPGIGPWTASYVALRALGDPDAFLATDLGVRKAARLLGLPDAPRELERHAERWRPWRSYAVLHLWDTLT
jgi:AraC family transcriptional regulator of adaptative response / DNA-3-methyladenine glycosylase II